MQANMGDGGHIFNKLPWVGISWGGRTMVDCFGIVHTLA